MVAAAPAAGRLIAAFLLPCLAVYAAACQAPYDAQPGSVTVLAAGGQEADIPDGLTIAAGERVLLAGTARVTGGVTIRGTLFLSSNSSSTLSADWVVVESGGTLQAGSAACPVPAGVTATIELRDGESHPTAGRKALAVLAGGMLELHGAKGLAQPWARLAATAARGATTLQLDRAVEAAGWAAGDELALASTDYDPYQTERVTIKAVGGGGRLLQVSPPLRFMHYGEVTMGVDERAEVALLSRSVRIVGAFDNPVLGCHTIAMEGFAAYHVGGVEYANCGQHDEVGRYPVHFHMAARVPAGTHIRSCAIHDSHFRAVTLHGTQGVLVEGNVAADVAGHAFFLEDGSETDNTFRGNLGMLVRPKLGGARLGSDRAGPGGDLSVFWITNPDNSFEGNAAAATEGWGFFVHTRLGARGPSAARWPSLAPHRTPLRAFLNNSAHSCRLCLEMEADAVDAGDAPPVVPNSPPANWEPRRPDGSWAETRIEGFTCHHSFSAGMWARMGGMRFVRTAWADSPEAIQFAVTGTHVSPPGANVVEDVLLVGVSGNVGDPAGDVRFQRWDARTQRSAAPHQEVNSVVTGFKLYDGPTTIRGLTARSWPAGSSVLAVRSNNAFQMAAGTSVSGFRPERVSYRLLIQDGGGDGGRTTTLRDVDGSLSGYPGATLLPYFPAASLGFYSAPGCTSQPAYGLVCPHKYVNLELGAWDWRGGAAPAAITLTRGNKSPGQALAAQRLPSLQGNELSQKAGRGGRYYNAAAAVGGSYLVTWGASAGSKGAPARAFAQCSSCAPGDEVEAVLCYPRGTTLGAAGVTRASWEFMPTGQDAAGEAAPGAFASLAAMRAATGTGSRYYFDSDSGLLFLRVRQAAGWEGAQPDGYCPPGGCAVLVVHAVPAGAAPIPQQCEARLAALPGAAASGDAFLAAALPPPLFDLAAACPQLPPFGCDCWGQTGCAGKACTAPERAPCDANAGSLPAGKPGPTSASCPSPPPANATAACASVSAGGDCCAAHCFAQAKPNLQTGVGFLGYKPSCKSGGQGCLGSQDGCRLCHLAGASGNDPNAVCPACVCERYGLPPSRCDPQGAASPLAAATTAAAKPSSSPPPAGKPKAPPPHTSALLKSKPQKTPSPSPPPPRPPSPRPPPPSPRPSPSPPPPSPPPPPPPIDWGTPMLVSNFASGALDRTLFDVEQDCWGGGNSEQQCYLDRPENLRVENGLLVLEARRGNYTGSLQNCTRDVGCDWTKPFTSARIRTKLSPSGSWAYGRFEVRARLPKGDFLWPAIWMLPTDEVYGTWAASGEIDIMEAQGQAKLNDTLIATLHYGAAYPYNAQRGSGQIRFPGTDFSTAMHDFALEWTNDPATGRPATMTWLVDNQPWYQQNLNISWSSGTASPYTQPGQPWDRKFHLILNLAVGGSFFPSQYFGSFSTVSAWDAAAAGWTRPRMEIEHFKVWSWPPPQP